MLLLTCSCGLHSGAAGRTTSLVGGAGSAAGHREWPGREGKGEGREETAIDSIHYSEPLQRSKRLGRRRDRDLGWVWLHLHALDHAVIDHQGEALRPVRAQQAAGIKGEPEGGGVLPRCVRQEVHLGILAELLLPRIHDECVVDGNDVDAGDARGSELAVVRDVGGQVLVGAGAREGSRSAHDDYAAGGGQTYEAPGRILLKEVVGRGQLVACLDLGGGDDGVEDGRHGKSCLTSPRSK